jgi:hypothetical protein
VIYLTAGSWPEDDEANNEGEVRISQKVSVHQNGSFRFSSPKAKDPDNSTYVMELWKSTDDGETWTNLMTEEGSAYPNDIHCYDETHCVFVAEGTAADSPNPGARVYYTSDGQNFTLVHQRQDTGDDSLMTVRMVSATEYWAGGALKPGDATQATLLLHSTDAGQSHENAGEGRLDLNGEYISSMACVSSEHCWATSLNAASTCNLMEFGGTTPPAPTPAPPTPGKPHYEKPPCGDDEQQVSVQGANGTLCAPRCYPSGACPTDKPSLVTALPECALQNSATGDMYCALLCISDLMCDKLGGASCSGGICTYPSEAANGQVLQHVTRAVVV